MSTDVLTPLLQAVSQTTATAPAIGTITPYNASAGALAPPLPALSGLRVGDRLGIQKDVADNSFNLVTPTCSGADTFYGGATSAPIYVTGEQRILHVVSVAGTKYWKVPDSINPVASMDKRYAAASLELYQDFTAASNGAPTVADSGQPWLFSYASTSGSSPSIAGGRYVDPFTSAGASASYLTAQLGGSVTYMEADFDFLAAGSTAGQNCTLVAWASAPAAPIVTVPNSPAHVVFTPTGYTYGVWTGNALTTLGTHTYATPVTTQTQHVEVAIDKVNGVGYVRGPDGVPTRWAHSLINTVSAAFACAEVFYTAASTDNRGEFQKFGASSKTFKDFGAPVSRARLLELEGDNSQWRVAVSATATSTTTVSTTAFANTTIPGLVTPNFTAPPSGKVTARYSCCLNITTAGLFYITAAWTGASSSVQTDLLFDATQVAGVRRVAVEQLITGLTPGGTYTITGQIAAGTASSAAIQIAANKFAYLIVEPVY